MPQWNFDRRHLFGWCPSVVSKRQADDNAERDESDQYKDGATIKAHRFWFALKALWPRHRKSSLKNKPR
jgi:hypothetical protein